MFSHDLSNPTHAVSSSDGHSVAFLSLVGDLVCCRRSGGGVLTKTYEFSHWSFQNTSARAVSRRVAAICISPDGTLLFTGDSLGGVVVWHGCFGAGAPSSTLIYAAGKEVFSLSAQMDGLVTVLAIGCIDGQIIIMRSA